MGLKESNEDKHQDEEDKHDQQDPKIKQKDQLFSTLNLMGMSISKMAQLDTLGLSESTFKRKRRQLKKLDSSNASQDLVEKNHRRREEVFYFRALGWQFFLNATKIATLLKAWFKDLEISEISIRRFLVQKGYKWKGPLQRVKNEVEQKAARLQFWKYNKYRNWNNVFFTDESSFYLRSTGINRWVPKNENNYVEKSKYTKKIHVWGAFWSKGVVKLKFLKEIWIQQSTSIF